jgi:hypothetical protein
MLLEIDYEEYLMRFNKFPKTKYTILLNSEIYYQFVTTSRSEEECIGILKKMTDGFVYAQKVSYTVFATTNGVKRVLYKGRTKSTYDI